MATDLKITESKLEDAVGLIVDTRYSYYFPTPFEIEGLLYTWDRYTGYMRQLKPRQKAQVRKIKEIKGVRAAIKIAMKLAHK